MMDKKPVQLKGTKDGIVLNLSDESGYKELINELKTMLSTRQNKTVDETSKRSPVIVETGARILSKDFQEQIIRIIHDESDLIVSRIQTSVMTRAAAKKWKHEDEVFPVSRLIRSGQLVESQAHILVVGEVNPGGHVEVIEHAFVLGDVKGTIHAGKNGNMKAVIMGCFHYPAQLRIASSVRTIDKEEAISLSSRMSVAYLDKENNIAIEELSKYSDVKSIFAVEKGGR